MKKRSMATRPPTNPKKLILLAIVMAAGLLAGIFLVQKNQDIRGRASQEQARLVISPNQSTLPVTVKVMLDPGAEQVVFTDFVVSFPKDQLAFLGAGTSLPNVVTVSSVSEVAAQLGVTGTIRIAAGRSPETGPITTLTEVATLTFDKATDIVSPSEDNVTITKEVSHVIALPQKELEVKTFGTRLLTVRPTGDNKPKKRSPNDLGLALTVKQDANGRDYIQASWPNIDSIERPQFTHFTAVVRKPLQDAAVQGEKGERTVRAEECTDTCTRDFMEVSTLPPDEYYINLRGIFKQKIVPHEPRQFFRVSPRGRITVQ